MKREYKNIDKTLDFFSAVKTTVVEKIPSVNQVVGVVGLQKISDSKPSLTRAERKLEAAKKLIADSEVVEPAISGLVENDANTSKAVVAAKAVETLLDEAEEKVGKGKGLFDNIKDVVASIAHNNVDEKK